MMKPISLEQLLHSDDPEVQAIAAKLIDLKGYAPHHKGLIAKRGRDAGEAGMKKEHKPLRAFFQRLVK